MPLRVAALPVRRGYPVPWFVAWLNEAGENVAAPSAAAAEDPFVVAEFRVTKPAAALLAHRGSLCWVCGQKLGRYKAFLIGPMCAVNRNTIDAPSHVDCADWSARACPFLARPHAERRTKDLPPGTERDRGMIDRNPGVTLLWKTSHYALRAIDRKNGVVYFDIGDPEDGVAWFRQGRPATRAEVEESITSGLPALQELADKQGPIAVALLERRVESVTPLLPERLAQ